MPSLERSVENSALVSYPQKGLAVFLLGVNWYNSAKVAKNLPFSVPAKDMHQFAKHRQAVAHQNNCLPK